MTRKLTTADVARALGVDPQTVRYQARRGRFPHEMTPGGHRRFDLDEVQTAIGSSLSSETAEAKADPSNLREAGWEYEASVGSLDFETELGPSFAQDELNESARMLLAATAGHDERNFEAGEPSLPARNFIDTFAVPGSARYPHNPHTVGAGY